MRMETCLVLWLTIPPVMNVELFPSRSLLCISCFVVRFLNRFGLRMETLNFLETPKLCTVLRD